MQKLTQEQKEKIINLYNEGLNCNQIKEELNLKYHQPILNVLKKLSNYIPYKNGRNINRKYTLNENYFKDIDSQNKAYIFGFICADGYLDIKNNRLKFLVQTEDEDILLKIKNELKSDTLIKRIIRNSNFNYGKREFFHSTIEFCSKTLIKDLLNLGIPENKTYNLSGEIIKFIPKEYIFDFMRGYFDGDGSLFYNKKYSSGTKYLIQIAGNKDFLEKVFMKFFPTNCKLYFYKNSLQTWCYKISSKEEVNKFLNIIYNNSKLYLNRKYEIFKQSGHVKPIELLET